MAGVVGTALMLLECSGVGAVIELDAIPRPDHVPLARWLTAFPSFGYVVSVRPDHTPAVTARFAERGIAAARIGRVDASRVARVRGATGDDAVVWDFQASPLMGCGQDEAEAAA
jgi:selenophosphate synthetase-related protein